MKIFGLRILTERNYQAGLDGVVDECNKLLAEAADQMEFWKAKYYYAKARALVAQGFIERPIVVRPCRHGGVEIEIDRRDPDRDEVGAV